MFNIITDFVDWFSNLGNSSLLEHLVELLDINVDEVRVSNNSAGLSIRLELFLLVWRAGHGHGWSLQL